MNISLISYQSGYGKTELNSQESENSIHCGFYSNILADWFWNDKSWLRSRFNKDFTKLSAILYMENGERHVGWLEEDGSFYDVSSEVTEKSDFSALTVHLYPFFGKDDYFYFIDNQGSLNNNDGVLKRVRIDDINSENVQVIEKK